MRADRTTLAQFLIEQRRRYPGASGELNALILDAALACKAIAKTVAYGALDGAFGNVASANIHGKLQQRPEASVNRIFPRTDEWGGLLARRVSEGVETPTFSPMHYPKGKYLLVFDPLDGLSNIGVNFSVGSIFSILRAPIPDADAAAEDFLQPGSRQVCAGYAIYGPCTMLVVTVGTGVHGFTLEPQLGEFILTHPDLKIPSATSEFAINASNSRFWEPAVKRYVGECLAGKTGARGKDFNMRWIASLVAETHRILMRGGVFLYPRDARDPTTSGRIRLLYEANPMSYIVEQAGGRASTGWQRVLDVIPGELHQRIGFVFGSGEEVELIERYHRDHNLSEFDAPLFGIRGLFRVSV